MRILFPLAVLISAMGASSTAPLVAMPIAPTSTVKLDMDLSSGRPAIMATFAMQPPALVTFDSGSQSAIIPKSLAQQLGLEVIGEVMIGSPGGKPSSAPIVSLGKLVIGGTESPNPTAVVLDDAQFPAKDRRLIIGPSQLANSMVTLDFRRNRMVIGQAPPGRPLQWQPLNARGLLHTTLAIGGQKVGLYIDTGKPRGLTLPLPMAERLTKGKALTKLSDAKLVDRALPRFQGQIDTTASLPGLSFKVGTAEFLDMADANLGTAGLTQLAGLLVIDGPRKRWALRSAKPEQPRLL